MNNIEIKYVCTGECGGSVTEEEYNAGKTTCGATTCSKYKHTFEKRMYCSVCKQEVHENETHQH